MAADVPADLEPHRTGTVYDAVAGRLTTRGFYGKETKSNDQIISAEQALFSRRDAPLGHSDTAYDSFKDLAPSATLPDSDLLKTIHTYTADFYARNTNDQGKMDERSLDETALIAIGILLEEAAAQSLGQTGALALVERE